MCQRVRGDCDVPGTPFIPSTFFFLRIACHVTQTRSLLPFTFVFFLLFCHRTSVQKYKIDLKNSLELFYSVSECVCFLKVFTLCTQWVVLLCVYLCNERLCFDTLVSPFGIDMQDWRWDSFTCWLMYSS